MVLTQISRSRYKRQNLSARHTYLRFGPFCQFFGDFWVYLGINSFSQRISEIYRNRKFATFYDVLKLEFEVKNWCSKSRLRKTYNLFQYNEYIIIRSKEKNEIHLRTAIYRYIKVLARITALRTYFFDDV